MASDGLSVLERGRRRLRPRSTRWKRTIGGFGRALGSGTRPHSKLESLLERLGRFVPPARAPAKACSREFRNGNAPGRLRPASSTWKTLVEAPREDLSRASYG